MDKILAIMPIKLNNERLPGKNTKLLGDKPLLQYELDSLLQIKEISEIDVYCSNEKIVDFLPKGVHFVKRPQKLDLPTSNFTQIFECFMKEHYADIYIYAHATAPFISVNTIKMCINAVVSEKYDSAFCAEKIQDYLWKDGEALNFEANNVPRSQDLDVIYRETSGVYVFRREVFETYRRRIGIKPFICEVNAKERIDINNPEDFILAEKFLSIDL